MIGQHTVFCCAIFAPVFRVSQDRSRRRRRVQKKGIASEHVAPGNQERKHLKKRWAVKKKKLAICRLYLRIILEFVKGL